MKLELQNSVLSVQDLKAVILEVQSYARWFDQVSIKERFSKTDNDQGPQISQPASAIISQWHAGKEVSQKSLDELITQLQNYAQNAPNITITLAAPPSAVLKKDLAGWCRQNIKPEILVDFKFNSTILGGMVVRFGSHVFDWSFKRQILENRQRFPEILRRV